MFVDENYGNTSIWWSVMGSSILPIVLESFPNFFLSRGYLRKLEGYIGGKECHNLEMQMHQKQVTINET